MPRAINRRVKVYTIDEACERLAQLSGHKEPRYSRGGFYKIVHKHKPDLIEPVITEADLEFLVDKMQKPGRPKMVDKNEQL